MKAAVSCSRRKICSNVRMTEVVPAPDEPVTAMMGCIADMRALPRLRGAPQNVAAAEQGRFVFEIVVLAVIAFDTLDLRARAEYETDALMQAVGLDRQKRLATRARSSARLLDDEADRIGFVEQAHSAGFAEILAIARILEVAAARPGGSGLAFANVTPDRRLPVA